MIANKDRQKKIGSIWYILVAMLLLDVGIGFISAQGSLFFYLAIVSGIIILFVLALSLRQENLPFLLLVLLLPLEGALVFEGLPSPLMLILGGTAVVSLALRLGAQNTSISWDRRTTALVLLLASWATISAIVANGLQVALSTSRPFWLIALMFILTQNMLRKERDFRQFGWVLVISLSVMSIAIIIIQATAYINSGGSITAHNLHINTVDKLLSVPPGVWGMRLTKAIPIAIYLSLQSIEKKSNRQLFLRLSAGILIIATISLISINSAIGLATTLIMMILLIKDKRERKKYILLGLFVTIVLMFSPLSDRVSEEIAIIQTENPLTWASSRGVAWYAGVQNMIASPIFGLGPGDNVKEASIQYLTADLLRKGNEGFHPHNIFISYGAQLGVPGLLIFIAILFSIMRPLWRDLRQRKDQPETVSYYMGLAVLIGLVAALIQALAISPTLDKYIWLLLGAGSAYVTMVRKSNSPQESTQSPKQKQINSNSLVSTD